MPMTPWEDIVGEKCSQCGGYATHWYGYSPLCCDCHGGKIISQEEAKIVHTAHEEGLITSKE